MIASPERRFEGSQTSSGAEAAACRDAATAPRGDLRRQRFRQVLRDLGLTPNQVWGLTKTDQEWSEKARGRPDSNAAGRYRARHRSGVPARLCLQRVPGAPTHQDGRRTAAENGEFGHANVNCLAFTIPAALPSVSSALGPAGHRSRSTYPERDMPGWRGSSPVRAAAE
jgi:hypothetical protein